MGRTLPSITQSLNEEQAAFGRFRRALRRSDQTALDELFTAARQHLAAAAYAANLLPMETFLLAMLPAGAKVERTAYETSGRMLHDDQNSVSYVGALVLGSWEEATKTAETPRAADAACEKLAEEDCVRLLALARETLRTALRDGEGRADRT
jgi:hypothetical protein